MKKLIIYTFILFSTCLSVFGQDSIAYREQHLQEIIVKAPHFTIEDDHIMCIPPQIRNYAPNMIQKRK